MPKSGHIHIAFLAAGSSLSSISHFSHISDNFQTLMSQSIPTGCIPPGQPPGISSKNLPGGSGFDF